MFKVNNKDTRDKENWGTDKTHHPDCKNIFISFPILRSFDNKKAANVLKNYINILKREEHVILRDINESHVHRDGLHLNVKGTIALAQNLISMIWRFWCNADSNRVMKQNNILLTSTFEYLINKNSNLKLVFAIFYQIFIFSPNDSPLKTTKNVFYFI